MYLPPYILQLNYMYTEKVSKLIKHAQLLILDVYLFQPIHTGFSEIYRLYRYRYLVRRYCAVGYG